LGMHRADYATPLYPQKLALTSPTFNATRKFIILFVRALNWSLSSASRLESVTDLRKIITLQPCLEVYLDRQALKIGK
jgi:hypothetical protein